MRIGIACTTYNRPAHLAHWTKSVADYSPEDAVFHIANDTKDRKGVAYRKTECIRELYNAGCDYFFITDDDLFPIRSGWTDFFIDALNASGQNHFCYMVDSPATKVIESKDVRGYPKEDKPFSGFEVTGLPHTYTINRFDNCNGCLMVMTRAAVEKVGAFNPEFKTYGFEHSNYSQRIHLAGLNPMGAYLCPSGASEYIYSCDLDNSRPEIQKKLKHKSSMSAREAIRHVQKNAETFRKPTNIFYPL